MEKVATELLENLADQLGIAVPYIWEVFVQQAFVTAVSISLFTLLSFTLLIISSVYLYNNVKNLDCGAESVVGLIVFWIMSMSALATVVCVFRFIAVVPTALVNPEYWALQQIVNMV
jgi:hypothetical protein